MERTEIVYKLLRGEEEVCEFTEEELEALCVDNYTDREIKLEKENLHQRERIEELEQQIGRYKEAVTRLESDLRTSRDDVKDQVMEFINKIKDIIPSQYPYPKK